MLYDIFTAIRTQLLAEVPDAKSIQWFNMQYDSSIPVDNVLLIEFPDPILFPQQSTAQKSGEIHLRIHVINQTRSIQDGSIADDLLEAHDDLAESVRTALSRFRPTDGSANTLQFSGWQHWHRQKGMLITFVDFVTHKDIA